MFFIWVFWVEGMAGKVVNALSASFSEYEFLEGDDDQLRIAAAASNLRIPWIDPSVLKLRHRIGKGPFGDVWLATYHPCSPKDYGQCSEVAIKMLHPIKQDDMRTLLDKFVDLYSQCQGVNNICFLQGISILSGKVRVPSNFDSLDDC